MTKPAKLTTNVKKIEAAVRGKRARYGVVGHPGLELRANGNGGGSWYWRYTDATGARSWHVISNQAQHVLFDEVFEAYRKLTEDLGLRGLHPNQSAAVGDEKMITLAEAFEGWLTRPKAQPYRDTTLAKYREVFARYVQPALGNVNVDEVESKRVREHVNGLADRLKAQTRGQSSRGIQANKALDVIRSALEWAKNEEHVEENVADRVSYPVAHENPEGKRRRAPTADETKRLWHATFSIRDTMIASAIRLQMLLARRTNEIVGARCGEFDLAEAVWNIPERTGNKSAAYALPLPPMALEMVTEAIAVAPGSEWLFPSVRNGRHISDGMHRREFSVLRKLTGVPEDVVLHEYRTAMSVRQYHADVSTDLRALSLNHTADAKKALVNSTYSEEKMFQKKLRDAMLAAEVAFQKIISA